MQIRGRPLDLRYRSGRGGGVLFLTAHDVFYTFVNLMARANGGRFGVTDYFRLNLFRDFSASVAVFCDVERISAEEEERLARIAALWEANDPAPAILNRPPYAKRRFELLKLLYVHGVNRKNLFRIDDPAAIDEVRFPCFIRAENGHLFGDAPRLLMNRDEAVAEIKVMQERGQTLYGKIICEFEDAREAGGGYTKYSYVKVGDALIAMHRFESDNWFVKYLTDEYIEAHPDSLERELRFLEEKPFAEEVKKAFEIAQIDYGRIDFGWREGGGIHVYEINTNPYHSALEEVHPARRSHAVKTQSAIVAAFEELAAQRPPARLRWRKGV